MSKFTETGNGIRQQAKSLVLAYMQSHSACQANGQGVRLSQLFRDCGFDWGDYPKTTSGNQQYWVGAILQELKAERKIERVSNSGPWRLLQK